MPRARRPGRSGEAGGRGWAMSHFSTSGQSRLPDREQEAGKAE